MKDRSAGLKKTLGGRTNWNLIEKTNNLILSRCKNLSYRLFPIYIKYFCGEKVIAILYYKNSRELELGLNLSHKPTIKGFIDAEYLKDRNINYSIKIPLDSKEKTIDSIVKLIECEGVI